MTHLGGLMVKSPVEVEIVEIPWIFYPGFRTIQTVVGNGFSEPPTGTEGVFFGTFVGG